MAERDPRVDAWRKATYRAPFRAGRTVVKLDEGRRYRDELPPNWTTLGRALGDTVMVNLGPDLPREAPAAAKSAQARLRNGWCPHPERERIPGRIMGEPMWSDFPQANGSADRALRWDECGLCGWRMNARISHVPLHPPGAPPSGLPAAALAPER